MKKSILPRLLLFIFLLVVSLAVSWLATVSMLDIVSDGVAEGHTINDYITAVIEDKKAMQLCATLTVMFAVVAYITIAGSKKNNYHSELYEVAPGIEIPQRCGQGQHGTAWFMSKADFNKLYPQVEISERDSTIRMLIDTGYDDLQVTSAATKPKSKKALEREAMREMHSSVRAKITYPLEKTGGGVVVGYKKKHKKELLNVATDDRHTIVIGSTGESKTRSVLMQTVCTLALAGESFFVSDTKGEIRQYSEPMLKKLGYNIITLDYRDMSKSMAYNYLDEVIEKVNTGDINKAMQTASDLAVFLAGEKSEQQEALWHEGKIAVLAAGIIACVYDNRDKPENQNLPYVYAWITKMCAEKRGGMLLLDYLAAVGDNHPANLKLAQANVAPSKTRGSFYTSAATALSIFTDWELGNICSHSDFKLTDAVKQPTAIFMHLPDNRKTFYSLATLFVSQLYSALTDYANIDCGTGRLPIRFNFLLEEFGNFTKIEDMQGKFSLARALGMRFLLVLQDTSQLKKIYGEDVTDTLKSNGGITVYLGTDNPKTNEDISKSCGNYTTSVYSESSSKNSSGSNSMNLTGRPLLYADEVKRISRPYELVISKAGQKISYAPDLSKYYFNKMLGLGDKSHNEQVRALRESKRKQRYDTSKAPNYSRAMWTEDNFQDFLRKNMKRGNVNE